MVQSSHDRLNNLGMMARAPVRAHGKGGCPMRGATGGEGMNDSAFLEIQRQALRQEALDAGRKLQETLKSISRTPVFSPMHLKTFEAFPFEPRPRESRCQCCCPKGWWRLRVVFGSLFSPRQGRDGEQ